MPPQSDEWTLVVLKTPLVFIAVFSWIFASSLADLCDWALEAEKADREMRAVFVSIKK